MKTKTLWWLSGTDNKIQRRLCTKNGEENKNQIQINKLH